MCSTLRHVGSESPVLPSVRYDWMESGRSEVSMEEIDNY